jgi:hypothetical protein
VLGADPLGADRSSEAHGLLERLLAGDDSAGGELLFCLARMIAAAGADPEELVRREASTFTGRFIAAESAAAANHTSVVDEFVAKGSRTPADDDPGS